MIVSWFSCGCSSFVATYLMRDKIDEIIYTHIDNQHPDSLRFLHDCEKLLNRKITILQSPYFKNTHDVFRSVGIVNTPYGAPCTRILKKEVRNIWQYEHPGEHTYIWGMDCTEKNRADRLIEAMPQYKHCFPLIDNLMDKTDVHGLCERLGLKRPLMYDLGYSNNNCVGCVKGGMGYWNKIRKDFPDVFDSMAKLEREIGSSCISGLYLDELSPDRGRDEKIILPECGIFCELLVG